MKQVERRLEKGQAYQSPVDLTSPTASPGVSVGRLSQIEPQGTTNRRTHTGAPPLVTPTRNAIVTAGGATSRVESKFVIPRDCLSSTYATRRQPVQAATCATPDPFEGPSRNAKVGWSMGDQSGGAAYTGGLPRPATVLSRSMNEKPSGALPTVDSCDTTQQMDEPNTLGAVLMLTMSQDNLETPTTTVASAIELFQQCFVGSSWGQFANRTAVSPALGVALMEINASMVPGRHALNETSSLPGGGNEHTEYFQQIKAMFYEPVYSAVMAGIARLMREAAGSAPDGAVARQLLDFRVSPPTRWPDSWNTPNKPDFIAVARLHIGFDRDSLNYIVQSSVSRDSALREIRDARDLIFNELVTVYPTVRSMLKPVARAVLSGLTQYDCQDDELAVLQHVANLCSKPNMANGLARPVRMREARDMPRRDEAYDDPDVERPKRRVPSIKYSLVVQLPIADPQCFKEFNASLSIQLWHLKIVLSYTHGVLRTFIAEFVDCGVLTVFEAMRVIIVAMVSDRLPSTADSYTTPVNDRMLANAVDFGADDVDAVYRADYATLAERRKATEAAFIAALCDLLLVIRTIPYQDSADHMAREELKRLSKLTKPAGMSDLKFWAEVVRRYRNWRGLLGSKIMRGAASEVRDFLPSMIAQIVDRNTRREIISGANRWMQELLAHFGTVGSEALSAACAGKPSPTSSFPPRRVGGVAPVHNPPSVIENETDMMTIYQVGENLCSKGEDTDGAQTTFLFLQHSMHALCEKGIAAISFGSGNGDSQLLALQATGRLDIQPLGHDDILYSSVYMFSTAVHQVMAVQARTPVTPPCVTPAVTRDGDASSTSMSASSVIAPVMAEGTEVTKLADVMQRKFSEHDAELRKQQSAFTRSMEENNRHLSHLASLVRQQFHNVAPADKSHATSQIHLTEAQAHERDKLRKNLGTLAGRFRRSTASGGMETMKYMDKPAVEYHELDDEIKSHLANACGVRNPEDWEREGAKPCVLCERKDHLLNRCLKMFSGTPKGRKFFGADQAAQRVKKVLKDRAEVTFLDVCSMYYIDENDPEALESISRGLEAIVADSAFLCQCCEGGAVVPGDAAIIAEFDATRERVLQTQCEFVAHVRVCASDERAVPEVHDSGSKTVSFAAPAPPPAQR